MLRDLETSNLFRHLMLSLFLLLNSSSGIRFNKLLFLYMVTSVLCLLLIFLLLLISLLLELLLLIFEIIDSQLIHVGPIPLNELEENHASKEREEDRPFGHGLRLLVCLFHG